MKKDSKIAVFGATGLVGSALVNELKKQKYNNVYTPRRTELDLLNTSDTEDWFNEIEPEYVFNCAAVVGGIKANIDYPAYFIYDNIMISTNIINSSCTYGVKRLINLGSSCIYPVSNKPIKESDLLTGPLERTNEAYAVAKIAALKMCQAFNKEYGTDFITLMPCNLYGPNDSFSSTDSHFIPGVIQKLHFQKLYGSDYVYVWGTGRPYREVMYSKDLAEIIIKLVNKPKLPDVINIGPGKEYKIKDYVHDIKRIVYPGVKIKWDKCMPDGVMHKVLDTTLLKSLIGEFKFTDFDVGIKETYKWFLNELGRKNG